MTCSPFQVENKLTKMLLHVYRVNNFNLGFNLMFWNLKMPSRLNPTANGVAKQKDSFDSFPSLTTHIDLFIYLINE